MTERSLARIARKSFEAPADLDPRELAAEIERLKAPALPLKREEVTLDGQKARLVEDSLRPIGAAIDPKMEREPARAWRKALLLKLSDLPGDVLIYATRQAVHDPFEFFSQVEKRIREHAADAIKQQQVALYRLERWQRELALAQAPALAAPEPKPVTQEEVDRMNDLMRSQRLATRWKLENGEAVMVTGPSEERRSGE